MTSVDDQLAARLDGAFSTLNIRPGLSSVLLLPGGSAASAQAVAVILAENIEKHHCFFHVMRFHNHISDHLIAMYSLGAPASAIKASFEHLSKEQLPALKPVGEILDEKNWTAHLGDDKYYPNYLSFFASEVKRLGSMKAIEYYLFNLDQIGGDMLNRSLAGVYHPIIHLGYGLEFGMDAIVAEGLALSAVHESEVLGLGANELIKTAVASKQLEGNHEEIVLNFQETIRNLRANEVDGRVRRPKEGLSVFEILHEVANDPELEPLVKSPQHPRVHEPLEAFTYICENKSKALIRWTDQWIFGAELEWTEISSKIEELCWLVVAIYVSSYEDKPESYKLDFFLMHCVTSFIFLPAILQRVDKPFQKVLLVTFFRSVLALWISRGRRPLHLSEVCGSKEPEPNEKSGQNWPAIISSAMIHPDEHTTKIVRTLVWASQLFGLAPKGVYSCKLPGSADIDGSIFYRAAVKTLDKHGWNHDVREKGRTFLWY